ncbi:MAG TPA: SPOR domain-containing protein [Bacteroidales bacterium]
MKTTTVIPALFFTSLLFVGCRHEKALTVSTPTGIKEMSENVAKNQQLNANDVKSSKEIKYINTPSGQVEVVAATSYQKPIVYAKTKKQIKEEKKLANALSKKSATIASTPAAKEATPATPAVKEVSIAIPAASKFTTEKDTLAMRLKERLLAITSNKTATQINYNPTLIASYLRTPADLKKFSVVVGSFTTLEKATSLVFGLVKAGYRPMVVPNENGIFRVIASTYNNRDSADLDVLGFDLDSIKSWILKK